MKTTDSKLPVAIVLATVAAIYFLFIHYVPYCYDDWNFKEMYMRGSGGQFVLTWEWFTDYIDLVRFENDGRLSDITIILFEFMPRWIYDVFLALSCVVWIWLSVKFVNPDRRITAVGTVVFWLLTVLFMPWRDWIMACVVFSLNYVIASALCAVFIWMWISRPRTIWLIPCLVLGFVVGCWHEGFSVSLAAGAFLMALARKRMPDAVHIATYVALLAGIVVAITAPGIINRLMNETDGEFIAIGFKYVARDMTMVAALAVTAIVMWIVPRWRGRLTEAWASTPLPFFAGACAMASLIVVKQGVSPRVAWPAEYFAILSLMILFQPVLKSRFARIASVAAYAGIVVFYANVLRWQKKTYCQVEEIMNLYEQSADGTVHYDFDPDTPVWTLHHPSRSQMLEVRNGLFLEGIDPMRRRFRLLPHEQSESECRR